MTKPRLRPNDRGLADQPAGRATLTAGLRRCIFDCLVNMYEETLELSALRIARQLTGQQDV